MPWADLSDVTDTLSRLLERYIARVMNFAVTVVPTPPDQLGTNVSNTISLYLHHVRECASTQNVPGPGNNVPNIAMSPFGLDLYYVMTAHQRMGSTYDATTEQRLMGYALKTFHDNPTVDDTTMVGPQQIIVGSNRGKNNCLNIQLRKMEPEQSLSIWTTGDRQFARLAAHYQVSMVLLQPELPTSYAGIVLSLGNFVSPMGGVILDRSHSELTFALPAAAGGGNQTLEAEPARPAVLAAAGPGSSFTLFGQNVASGLRHQVSLRNARWDRLAPPAGWVPIDTALNAAGGWQVTFLPDRVNVQIGNQVVYLLPDGTQRTIDVFPGTYTARIDTVTGEQTVGGQLRAMSMTSNEVMLTICPRITNDVVTIVNNRIQLNVDAAFQLDLAAPNELSIQVIVDGQVYTRRSAGGPAAGQFIVQANSVTLRALFPVNQPGTHSVRLTVEGAEAQPYWVVT